MSLKPEQILSTRISNYLQIQHPTVIFRFDLAADVPLPIATAKRNKQLQGKWSKGYPDLFIAEPRLPKYAGLYVELKASKTVPKSKHTDNQAAFHKLLRAKGYKCEFACGYDATVALIEDYLAIE